jgi:hypothetical protein
MNRLVHACQEQLSRVIQAMVTQSNSNQSSLQRMPYGAGRQQGGSGESDMGHGEAGEHDSDATAASELAETLWMYTQDRDALARLVEVLLPCMHLSFLLECA